MIKQTDKRPAQFLSFLVRLHISTLFEYNLPVLSITWPMEICFSISNTNHLHCILNRCLLLVAMFMQT